MTWCDGIWSDRLSQAPLSSYYAFLKQNKTSLCSFGDSEKSQEWRWTRLAWAGFHSLAYQSSYRCQFHHEIFQFTVTFLDELCGYHLSYGDNLLKPSPSALRKRLLKQCNRCLEKFLLTVSQCSCMLTLTFTIIFSSFAACWGWQSKSYPQSLCRLQCLSERFLIIYFLNYFILEAIIFIP